MEPLPLTFEKVDAVLEKFLGAVAPDHLFLIFTLVILIFVILSWILVYHWRSYSIDMNRVKRIIQIYYAVSALFILAMAVSLYYYAS